MRVNLNLETLPLPLLNATQSKHPLNPFDMTWVLEELQCDLKIWILSGRHQNLARKEAKLTSQWVLQMKKLSLDIIGLKSSFEFMKLPPRIVHLLRASLAWIYSLELEYLAIFGGSK